MPYYKKFARTAKKYERKAYKKVYGSRSIPQAIKATGSVAKDIAGLTASVGMIMSRLNVEKHHKDRDVVTQSVAQVNANSDGANYLDVTPVISQGTGEDERHGNSCKLTGISLPIQFSSQANTHSDRKLRVTLLKVKSADNGVSAQEAFEQYWDVNPLTNVRDYNAPRNYRAGAHDGITCVRSKTYFLRAPTHMTGGMDTEKMCLSTKFNVKLQDVLRFATDASTTPDGLKYYLIIQADAGNISAATSGLDIPIPTPVSGTELRIAQRSWWVDN